MVVTFEDPAIYLGKVRYCWLKLLYLLKAVQIPSTEFFQWKKGADSLKEKWVKLSIGWTLSGAVRKHLKEKWEKIESVALKTIDIIRKVCLWHWLRSSLIGLRLTSA